MKRIISLFASLLMTFNLYSMSPIDFEDDLYGVEVGYVNKQYVTRFPGGKTLHEDLFGREGSFLHGVQFGAYCQPMLKCGLGLRAGAYWEQYFSSGRPMGYESFTEGNFYLPLNVIFAIPLSSTSSISLLGGISMNYIVFGELSSGDNYYDDDSSLNSFFGHLFYSRYESEYLHYGHDGWPGRFNGQYEFGVRIRIDGLTIRGTYSRGITNHKFYWDSSQRLMTRERKLAISLGFAF